MANGIKLGSSAISALKLGSSNVSAVYQGTNLIYPVGCTSPLISTTSLSAYYKLNSSLASTVGPTPLTAPNGVTYGTGKFGNAAIFNGTTTYLNYGINSAFGGSANNISVMLWVNQNSYIQTCDIINYATASFGWRLYLYDQGLSTSDLSIRIGASTVTATNVLPKNTWTHIGFTYDNTAGGLKLYVNGSLVASGGSAGLGTNNPNLGLRIGIKFNNVAPLQYFIGSMDEINIWQRALTAAEVATLATNCPLT